jgi:hypothetical protein
VPLNSDRRSSGAIQDLITVHSEGADGRMLNGGKATLKRSVHDVS